MPAADQCCVPGEPGCSSAGQAEAAQGSTGFTICKLVVQSQSHCPTIHYTVSRVQFFNVDIDVHQYSQCSNVLLVEMTFNDFHT